MYEDIHTYTRTMLCCVYQPTPCDVAYLSIQHHYTGVNVDVLFYQCDSFKSETFSCYRVCSRCRTTLAS